MNHYCPECMDAKDNIDIEEYSCKSCKNGYCVHFMKTLHPEICWVCGSEYKQIQIYNRYEINTPIPRVQKDATSRRDIRETP